MESFTYFNNHSLPENWQWILISEIADTTSGGTPNRSQKEYYGGTIPWVKSGELRDGVIYSVEESLTEKGLQNSSAKLFPINTVLVALYGATVGRTGLLGINAATNQAVCGIFPRNNSFDPKYMLYWLISQRAYLIDQSMGGAQPNINQGIIRSLPFPKAPIQEQIRIVARIDELFSQLDAAEAALKRARVNLKRYRQSVLQAAVTGELTREWRETHKDEIEPDSNLLKQTLGNKVSNNETDLFIIPKSWIWTNIGSISASMKNGIYKPSNFYSDNGIACLRMYNIENGQIVWKNIKRMILTTNELSEYQLIQGDILINRVNSRELVGKSAVIPFNLEECVYESKNIRLRVNTKLAIPLYTNLWLQFYGRNYFNFNAQQVVGMASISQTQIGDMIIPLPTIKEQMEIAQKYDVVIETLKLQLESIDKNLIRISRLRQSILQIAFSGNLLSQDSQI